LLILLIFCFSACRELTLSSKDKGVEFRLFLPKGVKVSLSHALPSVRYAVDLWSLNNVQLRPFRMFGCGRILCECVSGFLCAFLSLMSVLRIIPSPCLLSKCCYRELGSSSSSFTAYNLKNTEVFALALGTPFTSARPIDYNDCNDWDIADSNGLSRVVNLGGRYLCSS
jgi:hypothetical protein